MYRQDDSTIALKEELFALKKKQCAMSNENQLLKVKVRKLQTELLKKDKQLLTVLNPQTAVNFRKFVSDQGAALVLNLRDENQKLQKEMENKNSLIKKLQNDLQTTRSYFYTKERERKKFIPDVKIPDVEMDDSKIQELQVTIPYYYAPSENTTKYKQDFNSMSSFHLRPKSRNVVRSRSLSPTSRNCYLKMSKDDESVKKAVAQLEYEKLQHNLKKIKNINCNAGDNASNLDDENLEALVGKFRVCCNSVCNRKASSPESDLDRHDLYNETPFDEIQQLHQHFEDMIMEVVELKKVITDLQNQKSHDGILFQKKVAEEETFKKMKPIKKVSKIQVKQSKSESDKELLSSKHCDIPVPSRKIGKQKSNTTVKNLESNKYNRKSEEDINSEKLFVLSNKMEAMNKASYCDDEMELRTEIEIIEDVTEDEDDYDCISFGRADQALYDAESSELVLT